MARLRRFLVRLVTFFRFNRAEDDLARELASHLALMEDEFVQKGMTTDAARLAARRAFGGVEQTKERHRDARSLVWLDDLARDVRYAVRALRRAPGFTTLAIVMLALGIGVNTAVFSLTNTMLFKGFPSVTGNDRILYINCLKAAGGGCGVSYPDFEDWRAQATSFQDVALVNGLDVTLSDRDLPETMFAAQVTVNAFRVIGQRPLLGRDFAASDALPGAPAVAILSYGLWEREYGQDPAIIGRTIKMGGTAAGSVDVSGDASTIVPTTVIGVMAPGFSFPFKETLWVPLVPTPRLLKRDARSLWFAFGRLVDGVTIQHAREEMNTIGDRLASAYPATNQDIRLRVRTFAELWPGPNATVIYGSLWGAVACVLVIVCANLANLLLGRAIGRSREMAIRIALGAGRWRVIQQLLIESLMLSVIAGALGWWLATWGVRAYVLAQPPGTNFDYALDLRVLGYLVAISVGTGFLFGVAPASRLSTLDVTTTLKDAGPSATAGRGRHLSAALVIGEMALAVVLLTGAGIMIRSFLKIYTADLGVNPANILTVTVSLPVAKYPNVQDQISFYDRLKTRFETIPAVESVAFTDTQQPSGYTRTRPYELGDAPVVGGERRPTLPVLIVTSGYFRTLGAAVVVGREFNDDDNGSGVPVVIVNHRLATTFWPGADPLGQRMRFFDGTTPEAWLTVVGVVSDIAQSDPTGQWTEPLVYVSYRQHQRRGGMLAIARTRVPPERLVTAFRREIQALDPDVPFVGLSTLAERLQRNYQDQGFVSGLLSLFAAMALLLASLGLYTVVAHSVSQRTREIGIRTAMGATAADILALVFRQGMLPAAIGLALGLAAVPAVTPLLRSQLIQVSPVDPLTMLASSATLMAAAALGCLVPARRATKVDPLIALRCE